MTSESGESMEEYVVKVMNGCNEVIFRFNELADAMEFIGICVETADEGTQVKIGRGE